MSTSPVGSDNPMAAQHTPETAELAAADANYQDRKSVV